MVNIPFKSGSRVIIAPIFGMTMLLAVTTAHAAIVESAMVVTNDGQYSVNRFFNPLTSTTGNQAFVLGTNPGYAKELGVNVYATAASGSFFFDQNLWRIGQGSAAYETTVAARLTNTGETAVTTRFDSLIVPGYIAISGPAGSDNNVGFDFLISQVTDGVRTPLYAATGLASPGALPVINTSSGTFTDLASLSNGNTYALTWGATNVSLLLNPIAAGSFSTIVYDLKTTVYGKATGSGCQGSQVAFGDPRNGGGPPTSASSFALTSSLRAPAAAPCSFEPVIGRRFDPYSVPFKITAVPEPASWTMLIAGFALAGIAMRRRTQFIA